jgi:aspartyl-tRNA(Asn)/glutamyl-tRNA(Gln) amidotransferase subunit A
MTEFAAMDPAPTRNPWNLAHTPGGSSSGSAAAVAAFLAPGAIGTQTAGSIVRPAAYCGIAGLKPTYGALERADVFPCAWSMDHVGPMARSVEDVALLFRALAAAPPARAVPAEKDLRIGIADRYFSERLDADTRRAFDAVVQALRNAGARIVSAKLPEHFEAGVDAGVVTMYCEMAAVHRERHAAQRERYGWRLTCLLEAGSKVSAADYLRAQQLRRVASAELSAFFSEIDCLITPATPAPAPKGLAATGDWTHNLPFSSSGHPALTVPVALSAAGLPIGVQLAARHGGEEILFRCGAFIERLADFSHEAPCR